MPKTTRSLRAGRGNSTLPAASAQKNERLIAEIGAGEYARQMAGGIAINEAEIARPTALGVEKAEAPLRLPDRAPFSGG